MASSTSDRRSYCPLYALTDRDGKFELVLDTLNASYEGLREENIGVDTFQVTDAEVGQPDVIAYRYYGDEKWWWLICTYNGIIDPYTELTPGLKLLIPKLDEVLLYLTSDTNVQTLSAANRVGALGEI